MLNSFFIQQSGLSGWKQIGTGTLPAITSGERFFLAESGSYLGLKTNKPQSSFHIVNENDETILTLQTTGTSNGDIISQNDKNVSSYLNIQDSSGSMANFGFTQTGFNHLKTVNTVEHANDPRIILTNRESENQVVLDKLGNLGVNILAPTGKLHVVQSGSGITDPNNNVAVLAMTGSDTNPEFVLKADGSLGINNYSPRYTVDISGHALATSGISTLKVDSHIYGYEEQYLTGIEKGSTTAPQIVIDFDGRSFRNLNLTGTEPHSFTTANGTTLGENEMKSVSVKLHASGGSPATFVFDDNITFLGYRPTGLSENSVGIISFNSFGPNVADTVAVFRQPNDLTSGPAGERGRGLHGEPGEEFRNKIIGGDFGANPWQRLLDGQSGFYDVQSGEYTADRFAFFSQTGVTYDNVPVFNIYKDSDHPDYSKFYFGQSNIPSYASTGSLTVECTSTTNGIHTGNTYYNGKYCEAYYMLEHRIEGYHVRDLLANDCTLSFFAKPENISGLFPISLRNYDDTISFVTTFDLCDTGEWKKFDIQIPTITGSGGGPILKSSFDLNSGIGLKIGWTFGASSGLNVPTGASENVYGTAVSGTSGEWITGFYVGLSGNTTGAVMSEFENSRVKIACPEIKFGHRYGPEMSKVRSQQQELELCKRYYERLDYASGDSIGVGQCVATGKSPIHNDPLNIYDLLRTGNSFAGTPIYFQEKRSIPSVTSSGSLSLTDFTFEDTLLDSTGHHSTTKSQSFISGTVTGNPLVAGHITTLKSSGESYLFIDSEL